jgi:hypothetical protein
LSLLDASAADAKLARLRDIFATNPKASLSDVRDNVIQQFSIMLNSLRKAHERQGGTARKALVFVMGLGNQDAANLFYHFSHDVEKMRGQSIAFFEISKSAHKHEVMRSAISMQIEDANSVNGYYDDMYYSCNKSYLNQLKNAGKRICYMKPSQDEPYIRELAQGVLSLLLLGTEVTIFGHSYGGSVALRVAQNLVNGQKDTFVDLNKLTVFTGGGIHPAPLNQTGTVVRVTNVIDIRDYTKICHHLVIPEMTPKQWSLRDKAYPDIIWINSDPNKIKTGLFVHNDAYGRYVYFPLFVGGPALADSVINKSQMPHMLSFEETQNIIYAPQKLAAAPIGIREEDISFTT